MIKYSKDSPEYIANGHYKIDGVNYMSIWTFKNTHKHQINDNETNSADALILQIKSVRSYLSIPDFGNFEKILIYPIDELQKYISLETKFVKDLKAPNINALERDDFLFKTLELVKFDSDDYTGIFKIDNDLYFNASLLQISRWFVQLPGDADFDIMEKLIERKEEKCYLRLHRAEVIDYSRERMKKSARLYLRLIIS